MLNYLSLRYISFPTQLERTNAHTNSTTISNFVRPAFFCNLSMNDLNVGLKESKAIITSFNGLSSLLRRQRDRDWIFSSKWTNGKGSTPGWIYVSMWNNKVISHSRDVHNFAAHLKGPIGNKLLLQVNDLFPILPEERKLGSFSGIQ